MQELQFVRQMMWSNGHRNNLRIRGLAVNKDGDCRSTVAAFLNEKLHVDVTSDDITSNTT